MKNGVNSKSKSISDMLAEMWDRKSNNNSLNVNTTEQASKNGTSNELFSGTRKEQYNRFRQDSKASNGNSNVVESQQGSFILSKDNN